MNLRAFTLLALLAPAVAGCTVNPATGERAFTGFMSAADEARVGGEQHPRIVGSFGGAYADRRVQDYVARVGHALGQVSERPDLAFTFTVLDSPVVNAFALPGGYIYVTRGLLALVSDEAELAAVLAHELGHLTARHAAQRYSQQVVAGLGAAVLGAVSDLASFGVAAVLQSYSREQEFEADTLAIRYLGRAGYPADAMAALLVKLDRHARLEAELAGRAAGEVDSRNMMATHPRTLERVQRAATDRAGGRQGREEYLQLIDGLPYGDNPEHGLIRGRIFIHPALAIRFEVPPGFRLVSGARQVVAQGPNGSAIAFDSVRNEAMTMTEYLRDVWGRSLKLDEAATLEANGVDGASATGRVQTRRGPIDLKMVAIRLGLAIHRFLILTPPSETQMLAADLRRTIGSFRALTPAEATAMGQQRMRLHTIRSGDTRESLAGLMAPGPGRDRRFEVINGIDGALPAPGTVVKLIGE